MAVRMGDDTWQRKAACRGPESRCSSRPLPEARADRDAREERAKRICGECAVRGECLEYALRIREPHGIWGGLNESERRGLLEPA